MASLGRMGNSLLDFVLALVRDPDAATRYAADPAGMLAAAGLGGVTTVDVNNLIPVVTDSLASSTPGYGGNVWTSGAATAAFDAFEVRSTPPVMPALGVEPAELAAAPVDNIYPDDLPGGSPDDLPGGSAVDEPPPHQLFEPPGDGWVQPLTDRASGPDDPGAAAGLDFF